MRVFTILRSGRPFGYHINKSLPGPLPPKITRISTVTSVLFTKGKNETNENLLKSRLHTIYKNKTIRQYEMGDYHSIYYNGTRYMK